MFLFFFKGKEIAKMDLDQTLESNEGLSLFIKEEKTDNTSKFFDRANFDFEVNGDGVLYGIPLENYLTSYWFVEYSE